MTTTIPTINNYVRLFRIKGLGYLINNLWMNYYKELNCIALVHHQEYTSYMPKETFTKTQDDGLKLFSHETKFIKFKEEAEGYFREVIEFSEKILQQEDISEGDIALFFEYLSGLFYYYSRTEFFYTDKAFQESIQQNDKILTGNLKLLGQLKNDARASLNQIFFGNQSYLNRILIQIGCQHNIDSRELYHYGTREIIASFNHQKIQSSELDKRRKAILMIGKNNALNILTGAEAEGAIISFIKEEKTSSDEIKGTIANQGKVCGKVKVIVSGYDNFDQLHHAINQMNKNDILVAETTSPELLLACQKAAAIITNQGGMLSHAAIISRELNIPCIVGTMNATNMLKDGDFVEVDAYTGIIKKLK